jgi:heavy metal translocating P-type ATPase
MKIKKWFADETKRTILCVILSGISLALDLTGWLERRLPFSIAWVAIVLCGIPIVQGAGRALLRERNIKADLLVSTALVASVAIGEYFAAGEVAFIMQIGTLLEDFTAGKARKGIERLVKLTPQTARVMRGGSQFIVPAAEVAVGDVLTVLAGETIPVDGVILSGETTIDQSAMTGESMPMDKEAGDEVTSGTVNRFGTFEMRALKACTDSSLQRMIRLAEEADANKAPIVGLADKWATWMVLAAFAIAVLTGLLTGEIIRAVTVLVVFCPCAFILATPTAVMAGIGSAARFGILVRSGSALERLSKIKTIAFDKTGTLTYGKPRVTGVVSLTERYSEGDILRLTALAEQRSEHPLGRAILDYYMDNGGAAGGEVPEFQMLAGQGVRAVVEGHEVLAGKPGLFGSRGIELPAFALEKAGTYLSNGATVIYMSLDGKPAGFLALADTVRTDAKQTVERLRASGVTPILLTGDNGEAACEAASRVGIDKVHYNLLPEEKMAVIRAYNEKNEPICMVGDGVNDALALRTAFAGIAMGGIGSDIAVESADAVLVSDEIRRLPYLFRTMKKVMKKVNQNIILAIGINILAVVLSVLGVLNPVTGALMHNAGSVFVVINAALLLREKDDIS